MAYLHSQYEQLFMYYTVHSRQSVVRNGMVLRLHARPPFGVVW